MAFVHRSASLVEVSKNISVSWRTDWGLESYEAMLGMRNNGKILERRGEQPSLKLVFFLSLTFTQ